MADLTSLIDAVGVEVTAAVNGPGVWWSTGGGTFRAASVTKTFVAATALALSERGALSLDEPVDVGFGLPPMTLRALLAHRAGLADHSALPAYQEAVLEEPRRRWTAQEQIALALAAEPPAESPHYSDTGYVVAGTALARMTGLSLGDLVASVLDLPPSTRWESALPRDCFPQRVGELSVWDIDATVDLFGGGGLVTTAEDLASFGRALFAGEVVSEQSVRQMKEQGLGLLRAPGEQEIWGHTGFWGTAMLVDVATGTAVGLAVGQAPAAGGPDPGALALGLLDVAPD